MVFQESSYNKYYTIPEIDLYLHIKIKIKFRGPLKDLKIRNLYMRKVNKNKKEKGGGNYPISFLMCRRVSPPPNGQNPYHKIRAGNK